MLGKRNDNHVRHTKIIIKQLNNKQHIPVSSDLWTEWCMRKK